MDKRLVRLGVGLMFLSCLMLVCLLCVGCGGENKAELKLTLVEEKQEELRKLAAALGYEGDLLAFDYKLEKGSAEKMAIEVWRYEDGRWQEKESQVVELDGGFAEGRLVTLCGKAGVGAVVYETGDYELGDSINSYACLSDDWQETGDLGTYEHRETGAPVRLKVGEECALRVWGYSIKISDTEERSPYFKDSYNWREATEVEVVLNIRLEAGE